MNVIQFGFGYMGKLLNQVLKDHENVSQLVVCDILLKNDHEKDGILFVNDISHFDLKQFDCAFITTPVPTHYNILNALIENGVKNIFVEKPSVISLEEFKRIREISADCKIVTGYILRQSEPMFALKHILAKMAKDQFKPDAISVIYQKNHPHTFSSRTETDIGVYDEIVHIWDLLFNFLGFDKAEVEQIKIKQEMDVHKIGRTIFSQILYLLHFEDCDTFLRITSSFKTLERKRNFYFSYSNVDGDRRNVSLFFDTPELIDWIIVTDSIGNVLYKEEFPSLNKLKLQVKEVFAYFETSDKGDLASFEEDEIILNLYEKARASDNIIISFD